MAHLLDMNKNTVQRVFQIMGWQVRKRPVGFRPRIQALPSVAAAPNEHWFETLQQARKEIADWRRDYNEVRPHGRIGRIPPAHFSAQHRRHAGDAANSINPAID